MQAFQETELKLKLINPDLIDQIMSDPILCEHSDVTGSRKKLNDSVYYDTDDLRLYANGFALRVRSTGTDTVATVKDSGSGTGGLFTRGEWEKDYDNETPLVDVFSDLSIGSKLRELIGEKELIPLFKTVFKRFSMDIFISDSRIELAADQGEIVAGDNHEPIAELELELKDGDVTTILKLGASLAERYPLMVERKSKYIHGFMLTGYPMTRKEDDPKADISGKTIRTVMTDRIISAALSVLDMQELFYANSEDPEAAHQYRVSLRILRALLFFVKPVARKTVYSNINQQLKALADDFSYIRELDVLLEKWVSFSEKQTDTPGNGQALAAVLRSERQKECERLKKRTSVYPATAPALRLWASLLDTFWTAGADKKFTKFSKERLDKWTNTVMKGLKSPPLKDFSKMHRLRILSKKSRYVQSALDPASVKSKPSAPVKFKRIQERLGRLRDAGRNIEILKAVLSQHQTPSIKRETELFIDFETQEIKKLEARIKKAFSKTK